MVPRRCRPHWVKSPLTLRDSGLFNSPQRDKESQSAETAVRVDDANLAAQLDLKSANAHDGKISTGEKPPDRVQGLETAERPDGASRFGATVVNAGSGTPGGDLLERAAPAQERSDTAKWSTFECARRYASFRESDGTYQPYGSSQRRLCHLFR